MRIKSLTRNNRKEAHDKNKQMHAHKHSYIFYGIEQGGRN